MHANCAQCGRELTVPAVCASDNWPAGWQIVLSREGEVWLCSHACAAAWHGARAWQAADHLASYPTYGPLEPLVAAARLPRRARVC